MKPANQQQEVEEALLPNPKLKDASDERLIKAIKDRGLLKELQCTFCYEGQELST